MKRNKHLIWAFSLLFLASTFEGKCQEDPFKGTERIVTQSYNFSNFNKISILDLDGSTEIEVGKPFSIETEIKDKYRPIFEVRENNGELIIAFKYTKDNNKYINNPSIKVKISCPSLDSVSKVGNSNIKVSIPNQPVFVMQNEGNGSAFLSGSVEQLSLRNDGNGKIDANNLIANTVSAQSYGNGDVIVYAKVRLDGIKNGNGKIIQKADVMNKNHK
jgi:hypothetical protein